MLGPFEGIVKVGNPEQFEKLSSGADGAKRGMTCWGGQDLLLQVLKHPRHAIGGLLPQSEHAPFAAGN